MIRPGSKTLYGEDSPAGGHGEALAQLGKHAVGKGCLYVNKLADVDLAVPEQIIAADRAAMLRLYPDQMPAYH